MFPLRVHGKGILEAVEKINGKDKTFLSYLLRHAIFSCKIHLEFNFKCNNHREIESGNVWIIQPQKYILAWVCEDGMIPENRPLCDDGAWDMWKQEDGMKRWPIEYYRLETIKSFIV